MKDWQRYPYEKIRPRKTPLCRKRSNKEVRTKRVSVLIGNQQLIGTAQIKRVSLAVPVLMAMKNEYLIFKDIFQGIHDDENNVCL